MRPVLTNNTFSIIGLGLGVIVGTGLLASALSNPNESSRNTYLYTTSVLAWAYAGEMWGTICGIY